MLVVVAVRDQAVSSFGRPFYVNSEGQALRSFQDEVHSRMPEFNRMSLKPGLGQGWFDKYSSDVYPNDYVVINGIKAKPPRFYDKKYECINPLSFAAIVESRVRKARERELDNTPDRLHVKETVAVAKVSRLKRSLA